MPQHITRISAVIGTAGHVDHGKTSLVKALTGIDTDTLKEEKRRGVSIDIGFAYLDLDGEQGGERSNVRVAIVDVPGHERFIKNMLSGTTGVDMALFVVAADDGIMPQTLEHLDICGLLGIKSAVFALTKCDMADEGRVREVEKDILKLIKGTVFDGSAVQRVSSITGEGIGCLKKLIEKNLSARPRDKGGIFRLPIDRSFSVQGFGAVVTGTIASGSIKKGDQAVCFPAGNPVRVRGLQSLYLEAEEGTAGMRAAVNISGISHNDIKRGFALCSPDLLPFSAPSGALRVDCFFEFLKGAAIRNNATLTVHHFTASSPAAIRLKGQKDQKGPKATTDGRAFGRLILKKPLLMLRGDRFILRDPAANSTVGGGVVHLPYLSKEMMPPLDKAMLPSSQTPALHELLAAVFRDRFFSVDIKTLSLMLNVREDLLIHAFDAKGPLAQSFVLRGNSIASLEKVENLRRDIIKAVSDFHAAHPAEAGMKDEQIWKAVKAGLPRGAASTFKEYLDIMIRQGRLKRDGNGVAIPAHCPLSVGADALIEAAVIGLFPSGGFIARGMDDVKGLPFKPEDSTRVFGYLLRRGAVVKIKEGVYMSGEAVNAAKEKLVAGIRENGAVKAAEFRDILGCGRKLAIEILEYLDREKVTLRQGDSRVLRG